jgi:uncharacterized membrane protein
MICPRCATANSPQARSCSQCGLDFDQSESAQSSSEQLSSANEDLLISKIIADSQVHMPSSTLSKFALVSLICAIIALFFIVYGYTSEYNGRSYNLVYLAIALFVAFFSTINGYTALGEIYYAKGSVHGRIMAIVGLLISQIYILIILAQIIFPFGFR